MKIEANVKVWGVEFEVNTTNAIIKEDLNSAECKELSEQLIHVSKELFKYSTNTDDLFFCKQVVNELQLNDSDIEELIEYLKSK